MLGKPRDIGEESIGAFRGKKNCPWQEPEAVHCEAFV
jgi:hypothetical protein